MVSWTFQVLLQPRPPPQTLLRTLPPTPTSGAIDVFDGAIQCHSAEICCRLRRAGPGSGTWVRNWEISKINFLKNIFIGMFVCTCSICPNNLQCHYLKLNDKNLQWNIKTRPLTCREVRIQNQFRSLSTVFWSQISSQDSLFLEKEKVRKHFLRACW